MRTDGTPVWRQHTLGAQWMSVGTGGPRALIPQAHLGPELEAGNPHPTDFLSAEPGPSETHGIGLSPLHKGVLG